MIELDGKVALVTGGSRGIGKAIGLRLARQGADVAFTYRGNAAAAEATVGELEGLGRRAMAVQADAADGASAEAAVKAVLDAFGKVDILVNNAGITRDDLIMRMSPEAWNDVIDTNLSGAFWMTKAITRPMLKARGGRIINITSVSGQAGQTGQANYSAAKAGLIGLTKASAKELGPSGVRVNAVMPGLIRTAMTLAMKPEVWASKEKEVPMQRAGEPSEVASVVVFLASPLASYVNGVVIEVAGGRGI
jgi:3-oxoacyl-[acyl-carrier protein] reductase